MNLHLTIPDERAKEFDAACDARKESREQFAERVLLAALSRPQKPAEAAPEPPARAPEAPTSDKKKAGG